MPPQKVRTPHKDVGNYGNSAVLLKFVGRQAKQALYDITRLKNGEAHLCLTVKGVERLIPLKAERDHGGSKVPTTITKKRTWSLPAMGLDWKPGR